MIRLSSLKGLPPAIRKAIKEAEAREAKKRGPGPVPRRNPRRDRMLVGDGLTDLERDFVAQIARAGLPAPDRLGHDKVHPIPGRRYELDLAYEGRRIGVEIHGGVRAGLPSHTSRSHIERDHEKAALCAAEGWVLLAFTDAMVEDGRALAILRRTLDRSAT